MTFVIGGDMQGFVATPTTRKDLVISNEIKLLVAILFTKWSDLPTKISDGTYTSFNTFNYVFHELLS